MLVREQYKILLSYLVAIHNSNSRKLVRHCHRKLIVVASLDIYAKVFGRILTFRSASRTTVLHSLFTFTK